MHLDRMECYDVSDFSSDHIYFLFCLPGNAKIYEELGKEVERNLLDGFNGCIIAYGQSGSGKTFTMMGSHVSAFARSFPLPSLAVYYSVFISAGGTRTDTSDMSWPYQGDAIDFRS